MNAHIRRALALLLVLISRSSLVHSADDKSISETPEAILTKFFGTWDNRHDGVFGGLVNGPDLSIRHRSENKSAAVVPSPVANADGNQVGNLTFHQTRRKQDD